MHGVRRTCQNVSEGPVDFARLRLQSKNTKLLQSDLARTYNTRINFSYTRQRDTIANTAVFVFGSVTKDTIHWPVFVTNWLAVLLRRWYQTIITIWWKKSASDKIKIVCKFFKSCPSWKTVTTATWTACPAVFLTWIQLDSLRPKIVKRLNSYVFQRYLHDQETFFQ